MSRYIPVAEYEFAFRPTPVARMSEAQRYANVEVSLVDTPADVELKAFNQHWERPYFQLLPKYRFRVVGTRVVMYDGCYYFNSSPEFTPAEIEERVITALAYGMTQIFPSLP